nr:type I restriction-modification enzyme R subunit C-terminal domain-containing protein [Enhydrobacter sp. 8BJ]
MQGWRPTKGQTDKHGELIEDRIYNQKDFDRSLVIDERTELVAQTITSYLERTDPMAKTIVFCNDIDHAERMRRALINCNPEQVKKNEKYVMKITGDDELGKAQLDNFINPKKAYPVIATTSELMTTGVDAQTCKLIVLDQNIKSMTKFKQVIGRGTRINDKYGKLWFTILDFKKATELFADESFDGIPERIMTVTPSQINEGSVELDEVVDGESDAELDIVNGTDLAYTTQIDDRGFDLGAGMGDDIGVSEPAKKYHVKGVTVQVMAQRIQYYDTDGKLVTESFQDYTRKTFSKQFASLDEFIKRWNATERKQTIIDELANAGIIWEALQEEVGSDMDPFDLICHVVYDQPPLTRRERANEVKKRNYFTKYSETAQKVLNALLDKYADAGVEEIESLNVLKVKPLDQLGSPMEIVKEGFGSKKDYQQAISDLEDEIYWTPPPKQA